jgi:hypothetical protein
MVLVAGLAGTTAALSYVTQKQFVVPNTVPAAMPDAMARAQQVLPVVSALSLLVAAGGSPPRARRQLPGRHGSDARMPEALAPENPSAGGPADPVRSRS